MRTDEILNSINENMAKFGSVSIGADELKHVMDDFDRLRAALTDAANGLYNGFEPDNQSAVYKRTIAALNPQSN